MSVRNLVASSTTAIETTVNVLPKAVDKTAKAVGAAFDILDHWIEDESMIQEETRQWRLDRRLYVAAEEHHKFLTEANQKYTDPNDRTLMNDLLSKTSCSFKFE